jgi:pimeloyl-ACP methyl ester carboxylesterase
MFTRQSYLLGLAASTAASPALLQRESNATNTSMAQSFRDVPVTKDIQYIPCFDNYACTQLQVPLDYEDPDAGYTNIAFLKYEAVQQPALGDIIFNPGGPGGSAIGDLKALLPQLLEILGDKFNIVGMDPRGVNNSGPLLDCFDGQLWLRDYYYDQLYSDVDPRSSVTISKYYEASGTFGTWCTQNLNKTAKYANTPATARDMLQYAELLAGSQGNPREDAKVHYYGISYGTVLGTTFAALHPDRVGKFVIDAVVDGDDYYHGNWSQNLLQADASVEAFFETCAEAGPLCAFYRNDSTASNIKQRFDAILADLEENPIPVNDPLFVQFPTTITHIDIRGLIMIAVYNPPVYFTILAVVADGLEQRNASLAAAVLSKGIAPSSQCDYVLTGTYDSVLPKEVIACNDNGKSFNGSEEALVELFAEQKKLSTYLGDTWPLVVVPQCRLLDITPPKSQLFSGFKKINTSTPILFADNVIDPVTSSAELMSAYFVGSTILLQEAVGHGLVVTSSNCTSSYVQKYFRTGELPPKNTTCETEFDAFPQTSRLQRRGLMPHHPALRRQAVISL